MKRALLLVSLVGCSSFADPDIVVDFRVLAMQAELPEQIVDVDIQNPAPPANLLQQVHDSQVCVLLSDRNFERKLRWSMTLCDLNADERCSEGTPQAVIGSGVWDDPDAALGAPALCATVHPDGNLLGVAKESYENDALRGLGGIYYGVSLRVGGEGADVGLDLYAAKALRLMPRIPAEIKANNNPSIDRLEVAVDGGDKIPLVFGRCNAQAQPLVVAPHQTLRITPVEHGQTREVYVVPTTDGSSRMFTESPTYQWLATAGGYSAGSTGGPRDAFGNDAILWTEWTAPAAKDLSGPKDVELWLIQRDERLGVQWYESCVRVVP